MSPRRSSRARTTQPPPPVPQHTHSSTSSTSSNRAERSTRSHHKLQSPNPAVHPRSESTEDVQDARRGDLPQTRQRKRGFDEYKDIVPKTNVGGNNDDAEEEEVTRCICGEQEYPGMPVIPADSWNRRSSKSGTKDNKDVHPSAPVPELALEDAGGLFIQCDTCKVWQHGGCVGIMDEAMSPEEYFCEQCRPDLHIVAISANGQKSSRYLPVYEEASPKTSPSPSNHDPESKTSKEPKSSRQNAMSLSTKRRSTMNSRDAAYDEEEQLRIAIEQSKGQGGDENVNKRRKRSRSDSEEIKQSVKRQRTTSNTPSDPSNANTNTTSHDAESEDACPSNKENNHNGQKKIRGAAARNHREKEIRDREAEREKARAEAAGRRKGRAERRRGDDSEPSDEYPASRTTSTKGADNAPPTIDPPAPSRPAPDTPPTTQNPPPKPSHRKTGRPSTRRGRLGRNQYTKDRDQRADLAHAHDPDRSTPRSQSRERGGNGGGDDRSNNNNHAPGAVNGVAGGESGKPSKPRYMNPHRTSMNEMKRRVAAILEFISRTQVEMAAGERTPPDGGTNATSSGGAGAGAGAGRGSSALVAGLVDGLRPVLAMTGEFAEKGTGTEKEKEKEKERAFVELSSTEMMDVLTRNLVLWQKEFGKYGEK